MGGGPKEAEGPTVTRLRVIYKDSKTTRSLEVGEIGCRKLLSGGPVEDKRRRWREKVRGGNGGDGWGEKRAKLSTYRGRGGGAFPFGEKTLV